MIAISTFARLARRLASAVAPEPGTTEGAVYAGMTLLAVGFLIAGLAPAAFLVPGAIMVTLGSLPVIRRGA